MKTLIMVALLTNGSAAKVECQVEAKIAESIQLVRILSKDSLDSYTDKVNKWSKPRQPLGHAITSEQIAKKDAFYKRNIDMAEKVYLLPRGWSPDYVGKFILDMCFYKIEISKGRLVL